MRRERKKKIRIIFITITSTYLTHETDDILIDKQRITIWSYARIHDVDNYRKELEIVPGPSKPDY